MDYKVSGSFEVQFLDTEDMTGDGIRRLRQRVEGTIEGALDEEDARSRTRSFIEANFPVRWKLIVGTIHVEAAA